MKKDLDLLVKNRISNKRIEVENGTLESSAVFRFRKNAYAFFGFLGDPGDSEFKVQIYFSDTPLNSGLDQLTLERKFSKNYLLDLVLDQGRKRKAGRHRKVLVSFERLFNSLEPFDELLKIAEERLAKMTTLIIYFNPPPDDASEMTDDAPVEVFLRLGDWQGGVMTTFKVVRDYVSVIK